MMTPQEIVRSEQFPYLGYVTCEKLTLVKSDRENPHQVKGDKTAAIIRKIFNIKTIFIFLKYNNFRSSM